MAEPPRSRVVLAFLAVYIIWGSTYLAIRYAVESMPPFLLAGARHLIAGALMYAWARPRSPGPITRAQLRDASLVGTALLLGGNGGVTWAERRVPSALAALVIACVPLWVAAFSVRGRPADRPGPLAWVGILLGLAGVATLIGRDRLSQSSNIDPIGFAALIIAGLTWAWGSVYSRTASLPSSALLSTSIQMLIGGPVLIVVGLLAGEGHSLHFASITARSWISWIYLVTAGSLIGFTAYAWLLRNVATVKVATYAYVNPVVAILLGVFVAGETFTPRMVLAGVLVLAGVALVQLSARPRRT